MPPDFDLPSSECARCCAAIDDDNFILVEDAVYCSTSCLRKDEREARRDALEARVDA